MNLKNTLDVPPKKRGAIRNFIVQESEVNSLCGNQRRLFVPLLYLNVARGGTRRWREAASSLLQNSPVDQKLHHSESRVW